MLLLLHLATLLQQRGHTCLSSEDAEKEKRATLTPTSLPLSLALLQILNFSFHPLFLTLARPTTIMTKASIF